MKNLKTLKLRRSFKFFLYPSRFSPVYIYIYVYTSYGPIPVALRSKALVCGCSLPGIASSNLKEDMVS